MTSVALSFGPQLVGVGWYGVFNSVAFLLALWMVLAEARRQKLDLGAFLPMLAVVSAAGLAGGRLAYVLLDAPTFARACLQGSGDVASRTVGGVLRDCTLGLQVWRGGMVLYGALLLGTLAGIAFAHSHRWPYWSLADLFAPPVALGVAVGRLGCLAVGCCFGKPSDLPWALSFPAGTPPARQYGVVAGGNSPRLHPTQLYEAAGVLILLAVLLWMRRRVRGSTGRSYTPGAIALVFLGGYAGLRFAVELFRGDLARGFIVRWQSPGLASFLDVPPTMPMLLSTSQLASTLVAVAAGSLAVVRAGRARRPTATTSGV
jgi:phosphatidylglycerol:prolipoprotein diacylglycerol transferase